MQIFKHFIETIQERFSIDQTTIYPYDVTVYGDTSITMRASKVRQDLFTKFIYQQKEEERSRIVADFIDWYREVRHKEENTPERIKQDADMAFSEENEGDKMYVYDRMSMDGEGRWVEFIGRGKSFKVRAELYRQHADTMTTFYNEHCTYSKDEAFLGKMLLGCLDATTTPDADKATTTQLNQQARTTHEDDIVLQTKVSYFAWCLRQYHKSKKMERSKQLAFESLALCGARDESGEEYNKDTFDKEYKKAEKERPFTLTKQEEKRIRSIIEKKHSKKHK